MQFLCYRARTHTHTHTHTHTRTHKHTHIHTHFLIKEPLKNRYTRKQPTHFSTTPLRPKLEKKLFFKKTINHPIWYA